MESKEKLRRQFLIALASARKTQSRFARELNVSPQAIDQIFTGRTRSKRLEGSIQSLIAKEFRRLRIQA